MSLHDSPGAELAIIRRFLEETSYSWANQHLIPGHETVIWPEFAFVQDRLRHAGHPARLLLSILRQGQPADEAVLRSALPDRVFEAMRRVGLLVNAEGRSWRTASMALVPAEGLLLAASLPPSYPTALDCKQTVYLGMESLWLARALPTRLRGRRVLDMCAGTGLQGLICAARGARSVTALELHPVAAAAARFNGALNDLQPCFQVRESNLYRALGHGELFDLVIGNPPFMPVAQGVGYPLCGDGGAEGSRILRRLFVALPAFMARGGQALVYCSALGGDTFIDFNRRVLEPLAARQRLSICAMVHDKQPLEDYVRHTLRPNLEATCPQLTADQQTAAVASWRRDLQQRRIPHSMVYGQLLRVCHAPHGGDRNPGLRTFTLYDPASTDPLMARSLRARAWA